MPIRSPGNGSTLHSTVTLLAGRENLEVIPRRYRPDENAMGQRTNVVLPESQWTSPINSIRNIGAGDDEPAERFEPV